MTTARHHSPTGTELLERRSPKSSKRRLLWKSFGSEAGGLSQHFTKSFQRDIVWNLVSLAVIAMSGIALNVLIGLFYDAATLGIFNQVFTAYLLASQFAVGGCHYSTLKHVADYSQDPQRCSEIILAAMFVAVPLAALAAGLFWLSSGWIGQLLGSREVAVGIRWAAPGLFFFALNKVLLAALNGQSRLRVYAVLQALRPVLIIAALSICAWRGVVGGMLSGAFTAAEALLLPCLVAALWNHLRVVRYDALRNWAKTHFSFGMRGFSSGLLAELNGRVDVLMLGYFATDTTVGIYSFAAMLAEGIMQLPYVLRTNVNPLLASLLARKDHDQLKLVLTQGKLITYVLVGCVALAATLLYSSFAEFVANDANLRESWPLFAILMLGVVAASGYIPFSQILLMADRPGLHSTMILALVVANVASGAVLIPLWGAAGAAVTAALGLAFSVLILKFLAGRAIAVRL